MGNDASAMEVYEVFQKLFDLPPLDLVQSCSVHLMAGKPVMVVVATIAQKVELQEGQAPVFTETVKYRLVRDDTEGPAHA